MVGLTLFVLLLASPKVAVIFLASVFAGFLTGLVFGLVREWVFD